MRLPLRRSALATLALLMTLVLAAGCSRGRPAGESAAVAPPDSAAAGTPVVVRATPAQLAGALKTGAGRPTLLNVWATWCTPCREEFPGMLAAARRHPGLRLMLVSADFDEQLPEARRFLAEHGVADTTFLKSGGDQEFIDTLNPAWSGALPATFVYDARGRRVAFWEGAADSTRFESAIVQAMRSNPQEESHP